MFRWTERVLFFITQKLVFLAFIAVGFLGYQMLSTQYFNANNTPNIQFGKYQNLIQNQKLADNPNTQLRTENQQRLFNIHIRNIVDSLTQLPDADIDKTDLSQRIKLLVEIKSHIYSQDLQLSYAQSLAKLTKNLVQMNREDIHIDQFFEWHDREFAKQFKTNLRKNHKKIRHISDINSHNLFSIFKMLSKVLGVFLLFVMILAILRIEKNSRK